MLPAIHACCKGALLSHSHYSSCRRRTDWGRGVCQSCAQSAAWNTHKSLACCDVVDDQCRVEGSTGSCDQQRCNRNSCQQAMHDVVSDRRHNRAVQQAFIRFQNFLESPIKKIIVLTPDNCSRRQCAGLRRVQKPATGASATEQQSQELFYFWCMLGCSRYRGCLCCLFISVATHGSALCMLLICKVDSTAARVRPAGKAPFLHTVSIQGLVQQPLNRHTSHAHRGPLAAA